MGLSNDRSTESGLMQPDIDRLRLKVNSRESHLVRNCDVRFTEAAAFQFLRGGMIHFEDMQSRGLPNTALKHGRGDPLEEGGCTAGLCVLHG
jgi:hypothetical protein